MPDKFDRAAAYRASSITMLLELARLVCIAAGETTSALQPLGVAMKQPFKDCFVVPIEKAYRGS